MKIDKSTKMRNAWSEILEVDSGNISKLLRKIGKVNHLPVEIRNKVKSLEGESHELYLKRLNKIEAALKSLNLDSNWSGFLNKLDDTTIATLEFTSDLLSKNAVEPELSIEDLREMVGKIQNFKNDLIESEIPETLKRFMFERLHDIEEAIFDFEISGIKPIETAIESSVGSLIMRRGIYTKDLKWTDTFFKLIAKLATFVDFSDDGKKLIGKATKLLEN